MRTPDRDRRGFAIAALCTALVALLLVQHGAALHAEYRILPNGTAYNASVDVAGVQKFEFFETGMLGERVPQKVSNIVLTGNCSPCLFTMSGASSITFSKGNYTVRYTAPLRDYHLVAAFEQPYSVNISLPEEYDVRNPLLAGMNPGAVILRERDNSTTVQWNRTTSVDLRFYDRNRETLLYLFGNFWIIIAVVLLLPFILTMKRTQ